MRESGSQHSQPHGRLTRQPQALRVRPDFAIALCNLASVYYDKRELRLAAHTYRRAVAIWPDFPDA